MVQTTQHNFRETGDRIERLLTDLRSSADPGVTEKVEDLVHLLVEIYGAALGRMVEAIAEDPVSGRGLLDRLTRDELVASLLVLHDLHPVDTESRVRQALEKVRPYLGSHAGDVELLGLDETGTVRLRLQGSCHGCPSSSVTVKLAIERAIMEAAPEVAGVEVEGVAPPRSGKVISLDSLRHNGGLPGNGHGAVDLSSGAWIAVDGVSALPLGAFAATDVAGAAVVVCRFEESLFAYGNRCPGCGAVWDGGELDGKLLVCAGCGQRYDVRKAGLSRDRADLHLDPLPLLAENGTVRIAIPGVAG